ncbi:MAG: OmpH family outer membrane protein [Bacteroidales bacterium]|nr:OmpH family outer membrane protein [Bacteroidales bacterium]
MKKLIYSISFIFFSMGLMAQTTTKIAFVDTQVILEAMPAYQNAITQIDNLSAQWETELEQKYLEIDQMYKKYQAEAYLLPQNEKTKRENEIIEAEKAAKELQKKYFGPDGDLFQRRKALLQPIQNQLYQAINDYADANRIGAIFDISNNTALLFYDTKLDITNDIKKSLGL